MPKPKYRDYFEHDTFQSRRGGVGGSGGLNAHDPNSFFVQWEYDKGFTRGNSFRDFTEENYARAVRSELTLDEVLELGPRVFYGDDAPGTGKVTQDISQYPNVFRLYTEDIKREQLVALLSARVDAYTLIPATGMWQGIAEASLVIEIAGIDSFDARRIALEVKAALGQDTILLVQVDAPVIALL